MTDENTLLISLHHGIADKEEQRQASDMIEHLQDANRELMDYVRYLETLVDKKPEEAK